jgi:hypothetical protein
MPDRAILRFRQEDPERGPEGAVDLGEVALPAFRGPDPPNFQVHLRQILHRHSLTPIAIEGGVWYNRHNSSGATATGDIWEWRVTLAPAPDTGGDPRRLLPALAEGALPELYDRFIGRQGSTAEEPGDDGRALQAAQAYLEHRDGWDPQQSEPVARHELRGGDLLLVFRDRAKGDVAYVFVSRAGTVRGRLCTPTAVAT